MALPDYVILGAMKCGTSTLAAQLGAQEGLFMTTPKEPNFFSDDDVYGRGMGWYEALFDAARTGDLRGEASTHYTKLPTYPQTLARFDAALEAPKLIYMIRDPLKRAVSHYMHEWSQGVITCPLGDALTRHPEIIDYGRYAMQIAPWAARYGTDHILVLSLEEMQRAPQQTLTRAGDFLGREGLVWKDDLGQVNVSAERIRKFPLHGLLIDNPLARGLRRALVPQALRDKIKQGRQMQERPTLTAPDRARLSDIFAADRADLQALFPNRPDLDASYGFALS